MRKESLTNSMPDEATAAINVAHLLHPTKHFDHPRDVLAAEHIGKDEKRAILASWASDMFAIESIPSLRLYPGTDEAVSYGEILEALKSLDEEHELVAEPGSSVAFDVCKAHRRRAQVRRFGVLGQCR